MGAEHPQSAGEAQIGLTRKPLGGRIALLAAASVLAGSFAMAGVAPAALSGGSIDNTFNTPRSGANGSVSKVVSIAEGKSLIGGSFTRYNGVAANHVAKLNADGSLDRTFSVGAGPNGAVASLVEQADHKIIIVGTFNKVGSTTRCGVARLNADGSLDTGFATGAGATKPDLTSCSWVSAVALQGDKPIIAGLFSAYDGVVRNRLARLTTSGSLDAAFNPDVSASLAITTVAGSPNVTLASTRGLAPSTTYRVFSSTIPKASQVTFTTGKTLSSTVTLSTTVGIKAGKSITSTVVTTGANASIGALAVQPGDGKVLIGGTFSTYDGVTRNRVARLTRDGGIDAGFSPAAGPDGLVTSIAVQSDERVLIGGSFTNVAGVARNRIARLGLTGAIDPAFDPGTGMTPGPGITSGFDDTVYSLKVLSNDSILVAGGFKTYSGVSLSRVAALLPSGAIDTAFAPSPALAIGNSALSTDVETSSGQLLIAGFFDRGVARLSATGTRDADFNPAITSAANGTVGAVVPLAGGKILIGGGFTKYNGTTRLRLARLNADGGLDETFAPAGVADGEILAIHPLAGGQFLIGGSFTHVNGVAAGGIALMNADGSLDDSFALAAGIGGPAGTTPSVDEIEVQTNGKIILGGHFTTFNGVAAGNLVRLHSYGVVDSSFAIGSGADAGVHAVKIQADGKVLVGGDFLNFNGSPAKRLVRVSSTGARDLSFDTKGGASSWVKAIEVQSDGKIVIGGYFTTFAGSPRNRITRLLSNGSLDPSFDTGGVVTQDLTITTTKDSTSAVLSATDGLAPETTYGIYTAADLFTGKTSIPKADHVTFTTGTADADGVIDNHITLSQPAVVTGQPDEGSTIVLRGAAFGGIRSMIIQSDGKIIAAGSFRSFDGSNRKMVVRLRSNGSVDSYFKPGVGFLGYRVDAIARAADKKLLAAGSFFAYAGNLRNNIIRINP